MIEPCELEQWVWGSSRRERRDALMHPVLAATDTEDARRSPAVSRGNKSRGQLLYMLSPFAAG